MLNRSIDTMRRGNAVAALAICLPMLCGFAALSIDMGMIYRTKAELQRTADAGALAAALQLGDNTDGNGIVRAKKALTEMAAQNTVLGRPLQVDLNTDLILGQASLNEQTGRYVFTPTNYLPNAVKVRARRTSGSPSGPVPLTFAALFGKSNANVSASAIAVLTPRDIVFVLDLSGSHNDNSCLQSCRKYQIDNRKVWASLWDTGRGQQPYQNGNPMGPTFGNMSNWGDNVTGPNGINVNDAGLIYLPRNENWNLSAEWLSQTAVSKGYPAYTAKEVAAINKGSNDGDLNAYKRRVQVALGLARWSSSNSKDTTIDSNEVSTIVPYPSNSTNPDSNCKKVGGNWSDYIDYVISSSSPMSTYNPSTYSYGDPNCRYRFGLKTLVDYIQTDQPGDSNSPGLAGSPEQPMKAVADGVRGALDIIKGLESNDQVGMASFAEVGYGPADKPDHMSWLTADCDSVYNKVGKLQASMWTSTTNTAQGIDKGVDVLFHSADARKFASKVLILLTDGRPNQTRSNPTRYIADKQGVTNTTPYTDAAKAAQDAAAKGVIIYTVGVGEATTDDSLRNWLADVATIGHGSSFIASGDIETYNQQMQDILQSLGGKRPVVLAE